MENINIDEIKNIKTERLNIAEVEPTIYTEKLNTEKLNTEKLNTEKLNTEKLNTKNINIKNITILSIPILGIIIFYLYRKYLLNIKLDDKVAKIVLDNYNFENIAPNIITLIGIICNCIVLVISLYIKIDSNIKKVMLLFILFIRWLVDILDGAVARKYNKVSKLGHNLDTFSDLMLQFIFFIFAGSKLNINYKYLIVFFLIYVIILNHKYLFFSNHDNIKKDNSRLETFLVNNSYILFIYCFIFVLFYDNNNL